MSYMIRRRSSYLERIPYNGEWRWLAGTPQHASRLSLDDAETMVERLTAVGITDATVECDQERGLNVTADQVAKGAIELPDRALEAQLGVEDLR